MRNLVENIGEYSPDKLFAGTTMPVVRDSVNLLKGRKYKRGDIVGIITESGKATLVDTTKTDGREKPYAVLSDDVDATTDDYAAVAYLAGEFNIDAVSPDGETLKPLLRSMGIFLKRVTA